MYFFIRLKNQRINPVAERVGIVVSELTPVALIYPET